MAALKRIEGLQQAVPLSWHARLATSLLLERANATSGSPPINTFNGKDLAKTIPGVTFVHALHSDRCCVQSVVWQSREQYRMLWT